eukprot:4540739-Pleurochrysis_carterae.AAC.1
MARAAEEYTRTLARAAQWEKGRESLRVRACVRWNALARERVMGARASRARWPRPRTARRRRGRPSGRGASSPPPTGHASRAPSASAA